VQCSGAIEAIAEVILGWHVLSGSEAEEIVES